MHEIDDQERRDTKLACQRLKKKAVTFSDIKLIQVIGRGAYGKVFLVSLEGNMYAMKSIRKDMLLMRNQVNYV